MDQKILELGVGGAIALFILKVVFDFLGKKIDQQKADKHEQVVASLENAVGNLQSAIEDQTSAIKDQTKTISDLLTESKLSHQALKIVQRDTEEIRRSQFNQKN